MLRFADISFIGVNSDGKIENVNLEPTDQKCELPAFTSRLFNGFTISDLDGDIHLYDGNVGKIQMKKIQSLLSLLRMNDLIRFMELMEISPFHIF